MSTAHDFLFTPQVPANAFSRHSQNPLSFQVYRPKITHRRRTAPSNVTRDTLEENDEQERQRWNRRLARYQIYNHEQFHHTRVNASHRYRPIEEGGDSVAA